MVAEHGRNCLEDSPTCVGQRCRRGRLLAAQNRGGSLRMEREIPVLAALTNSSADSSPLTIAGNIVSVADASQKRDKQENEVLASTAKVSRRAKTLKTTSKSAGEGGVHVGLQAMSALNATLSSRSLRRRITPAVSEMNAELRQGLQRTA